MVINVGDQCLGSVIGDRELVNQNPVSRFLKFKEVRYLKHHYGDVGYSVKIL